MKRSDQIKKYILQLKDKEIEIIKDFPEKCGIILRELKDSSFHFGMQVLHGGLSYLWIFMLWHLPGGFHHSDKILITWSTHAKVAVIVLELVPGDNAIVVSSWAIEVI